MLYKIISNSINGYEIQDLIDQLQEHYKEVKDTSKEISVTIQISSAGPQSYPPVKEVKSKVTKLKSE